MILWQTLHLSARRIPCLSNPDGRAQDQYRWKAEIAKLEHGEKSAEYKLVKEEEKSEIRAAYKRMYDNIKSDVSPPDSLLVKS